MLHRIIACSSLLLLFAVPVDAIAQLDGIDRRTGSYPSPTAKKIASGSGLLVDSRHVLTNRHCVQDKNGKDLDGFNVFLGDDYKTNSRNGRVVFRSTTHDLAIIELEKEVETANELKLFNAIPPLTTKVVAYGFPLGSRFGVSLTASGGQISRLPAFGTTGDKKAVSESIWHDAVIANGSSGGPLFSESGVLLGLNFATIRDNDNIALAVPSDIVCRFLTETIGKDGWDVADDAKGDRQDITNRVVYVEALSESARETNDDGVSPHDLFVDRIKTLLPKLSAAQMQLLKLDMRLVFPPSRAVDIKDGQIFRIVGFYNLIQTIGDSLLIEVNGVRCKIFVKGAAEVAAKAGGNQLVKDAPIDVVCLVLKPTPYQTVGGTTAYYYPLIPASQFVNRDEFATLIENELEHRKTLKGEKAELKGEKAELASIANKTSRLRRTFLSTTGTHRVDAVCVAVDESNAKLLRWDDRRIVTVPLKSLSGRDQSWLTEQTTWIRLYGEELKNHYAK